MHAFIIFQVSLASLGHNLHIVVGVLLRDIPRDRETVCGVSI